MSVRSASGESVDGGIGKIADLPNAPTIGAATNTPSGRVYNNGAATVAFTPDTSYWAPTSYTVTPTPATSPTTFSGSSSPITVTNLASATGYTFTVSGVNTGGTGPASAASGSITATTAPNTPGTPTATITNATTVSLAFTAGATGGSAITSYTATSSPSIALSTSGTSTPLTVTGTFVQDTAYTFTITATNANGTSSASSASGSVTPNPSVLVGNYDSIATMSPLASATSSYTFSSIPSTYTHLQVRGLLRGAQATTFESFIVQFNGDTNANYWNHLVQGDGATAGVDTNASSAQPYVLFGTGTSYNSSIFTPFVLDILNYTNTNTNKTMRSLLGVDTNGAGYVRLNGGAWNSTAAITSLTIGGYSTNTMGVGTTFALYGIKG